MASKGKIIGGIIGAILLLAGIGVLLYEPETIGGAMGKAIMIPLGISLIIFFPVYPFSNTSTTKKPNLKKRCKKEVEV